MPRSQPPEVTYAFAHRGGWLDGGYQENSLAGFAAAVALGAAIETDVRLSLDGVPVLVHDVFGFHRGVPVLTAAFPAALMSRLGIPRLSDLYDRLGTEHVVSMDLKEVRAWPKVLEVARRYGAIGNLWLVHDDLDVLADIRRADDEVHLVHEARPTDLKARGEALVDHPARLAELGIDAQNTRANAWTAEAREAAREHGVLAFGSLVPGGTAQTKAARLGLDGLYSDHAADLVGAIGDAVERARARAREQGTDGDDAATVTVTPGTPDHAGTVTERAEGAAGGEAPTVGGKPVTVSVHDEAAPGPTDAPIRAVLFDFGHTLFNHAPGPEVVRVEAAELGRALSAEEARAIWERVDAAAQTDEEKARGRDLDDRVWAERWKVLYGLADDTVPGLGAALDRSWHDPADWIPYADTEEALAALAAAGVPIGVISNTGWDVRAVFRHWGLDRYVGSYTLSYEAGAVKPEPEIFRRACDDLGVDPAETLMVGDDEVADAGAVAAGLASAVLVDPDTPIGRPHGLLDAVAPALADAGPGPDR